MADRNNEIKEAEVIVGPQDRIDIKTAPPRRRGAGFAPILAVGILLVGGIAAYTFFQSADQTEARNGQLANAEQSETVSN